MPHATIKMTRPHLVEIRHRPENEAGIRGGGVKGEMERKKAPQMEKQNWG
jgi:hypothetical protein